tara:strand:- start:1747 stop:2175 length:429 start_codon:yes stop_codon:yes gene_type:complete
MIEIRCNSMSELIALEAIVDHAFQVRGLDNPSPVERDDWVGQLGASWRDRYISITDGGIEGWPIDKSVGSTLRRFSPELVEKLITEQLDKSRGEVFIEGNKYNAVYSVSNESVTLTGPELVEGMIIDLSVLKKLVSFAKITD